VKGPTLAICTPAYNEQATLPRLLASIRAQTMPFDEVWLYDDCSTDDTVRLAEEFGANVVRGTENHGCSYGKNSLAGRTTCDYVHFLDADDALLPRFVERARRWMARPDAPDVVLFDYEYRDHTTGALIASRHFDCDALRKDAVRFTIHEQINNVGIYRREAFLRAGGFDLDPNVLYNEDVAMHTRLARAGLRFASEETVSLIMYRKSGSMSAANRVKCSRAQYHVLRKCADDVGSSHGADIAHHLWQVAGIAAAQDDWETADSCVALACRLHGRRPPAGDPLFRLLCAASPPGALRLRESLIRWFKPHLRRA
jgi:glycosyltransferase involved in cell wall biosynthesis